MLFQVKPNCTESDNMTGGVSLTLLYEGFSYCVPATGHDSTAVPLEWVGRLKSLLCRILLVG